MKLAISVFFFLIVPLFIVFGSQISFNFPNELATLNKLARNGTIINGALALRTDGFLGENDSGFVYEGIMMIKEGGHKKVAINFFTLKNAVELQREYEIFTYLKATDQKNVNVERFGIPAVYCYGHWDGFILIAITKLDEDLINVGNSNSKHFPTSLDALILIRNFIIQSKYMHSCGVRHDNIKPENIMFRGYKSFLIDFQSSSKMMEDNRSGTLNYAPRRLLDCQNRLAIDDWESFLYTISYIVGIPLDWFKPANAFFKLFINQYCSFLKWRTEKNRKCINDNVDDGALKLIINEIANEVFSNNVSKAFPDYDRLYELVNVEMAKMHESNSTLPPMFSWLSEAQKLQAKHEIDSTVPLNIKTEITEPSSIDFKTFSYPHVKHPTAIVFNGHR